MPQPDSALASFSSAANWQHAPNAMMPKSSRFCTHTALFVRFLDSLPAQGKPHAVQQQHLHQINFPQHQLPERDKTGYNSSGKAIAKLSDLNRHVHRFGSDRAEASEAVQNTIGIR